MPVSMEFLRGMLGLFGIGCAYLTGRSFVAVRKGWQKSSRLYGWIFRTVVCLLAMAFRFSLDFVDMLMWALAVVAFGIGYWNTSREKPQEDLTRTIFPDETNRRA
jgi:hypothetical protein